MIYLSLPSVRNRFNSLRPRDICVSKICHCWFRQWFVTGLAPNNYLNRCWIIANQTILTATRRPFCLGVNLLTNIFSHCTFIPAYTTVHYTHAANHPLGSPERLISPWWHQMEIFSALLALGDGHPPVSGGFPSLQRPVTQSFGVFHDLRLSIHNISGFLSAEYSLLPISFIFKRINRINWYELNISEIVQPSGSSDGSYIYHYHHFICLNAKLAIFCC